MVNVGNRSAGSVEDDSPMRGTPDPKDMVPQARTSTEGGCGLGAGSARKDVVGGADARCNHRRKVSLGYYISINDGLTSSIARPAML